MENHICHLLALAIINESLPARRWLSQFDLPRLQPDPNYRTQMTDFYEIRRSKIEELQRNKPKPQPLGDLLSQLII